MCKIGVIMSIYYGDQEVYVEEAVNSILAQTYQDYLLFIGIDGQVSDGINRYVDILKRHPQITIVRFPINRGLACTANDLINLAISKGCSFLARMDADDISMPNRFEKQISFLEKHPDIDCLGAWAIEITSDNMEFHKKKMPVTHEECFEFFMKRDCVIHPTVMLRKRYIEKAGMYPTDTFYCEDTMMWAHGFLSGCKFANIPEYLLKYRIGADFFNRRRGWKHAKSILLLRWKVNKILNFPVKAHFYTILYALAKMAPTSVLKLLYKIAR